MWEAQLRMIILLRESSAFRYGTGSQDADIQQYLVFLTLDPLTPCGNLARIL